MRTFDVHILSHLPNIRAVNIKVRAEISLFSQQYHAHTHTHIQQHTWRAGRFKCIARTLQHFIQSTRIFSFVCTADQQRKRERRCTRTPLIWEVSSCCCKLPSVWRIVVSAITMRQCGAMYQNKDQKNVHRLTCFQKDAASKMLERQIYIYYAIIQSHPTWADENFTRLTAYIIGLLLGAAA